MIRFANCFGDGMLLQRDTEFTVWGYAEGAVTGTLEGGGRRFESAANAENGRFCLHFPAVSARGREPFRLCARCGKESAEVHNILFGDLYLAMGQSNMAYQLSAVEEREELWGRAARQRLRLLDVREPEVSDLAELLRPPEPCQELRAGIAWFESGDRPRTMAASAIGVLAGMRIAELTGVPVGVVATAMGGLNIESYLPRDLADADPDLQAYLKRSGRYTELADYNRMGWLNYTQLAGVYNEKIAPLAGEGVPGAGLRFAGMIWYLGESSTNDYESARRFHRELGLLVGRYRRLFGDIPFAAVHIAPEFYPTGDDNGYLYVNEAIADACRDFGLWGVPTFDVEPRWLVPDGELYYHPIHPVNKLPVAERIAELFVRNLYEGRPFRFPEIAAVEFSEGRALCRVAHVGSGLSSPTSAAPDLLPGFALAGADGVYYAAEGKRLSCDLLSVSCPEVSHPEALTYAFCQYQETCDARTAEGFPLTPCRTRREALTPGYYLSPPWLSLRRLSVFESCYGWQIGTSRRVPTWTEGNVYRSGKVALSLSDRFCGDAPALRIETRPDNETFYFFGASPNLCVTGAPCQLADYPFLQFRLAADGEEVEFFGVFARLSDGRVFRFLGKEGENVSVGLRLGPDFQPFSANLETAYREDTIPFSLSEEQRRRICALEFAFRSRRPCAVLLGGLRLSDRPQNAEYRAGDAPDARADTQLPGV